MSAFFRFDSMIIVVLFFICSSSYVRALKPNWVDPYKKGFRGIVRSAAVIGDRLSPFVALMCLGMGLFNLIGLIMRVVGVSLSQFHDKAGFQLVTSLPEDSPLSPLQFKLYSDFILPREELCGRTLTIEFMDKYFLVVRPILSTNRDQDKTYIREKYIYSLSLVVEKTDYLPAKKQPLYRQMVSKLAQFFKVIEERHHIIYYHTNYEGYITSILDNFLDEINSRGVCDLTYICSHYTFINATHSPHNYSGNELQPAAVPLTILTPKQIKQIESPLGRQLLQYAMQGTYTFSKICRLHRDHKQAQLRAFYEGGVQKGLVYILDMVNIQNCYVLTKEVLEYLPQGKKHERLHDILDVISSSPQITILELLCLYLQFNRVITLHKIIELNKKVFAKINIYKMIRMGQLYGFLKRIHKKVTYTQYPTPLILLEPLKRVISERQIHLQDISERFLREEAQKMGEQVKGYIANGATVDEMMVSLEVSEDRLFKMLNPHNRFILQVNLD